MKIGRTKTLAIEIFKTANELNHNFNKTIFASKTKSRVWPFSKTTILKSTVAKFSWQ